MDKLNNFLKKNSSLQTWIGDIIFKLVIPFPTYYNNLPNHLKKNRN